MRDYVIINGVNSLTIKGLAISKLPPISKPLMRNMKEEIDGRDGDIITELGYSAYDKTMEIGLYGNFDINEVVSFFNGEGTITFSNEDDKHYYFKILEQIDYEKLLKFKTATITFHCQPFKYPNNEQIIDVDSLTVEGTGTDITLANTSLYAPINTELLGDTTQDGTPTPESPIDVETVEGEQTISVKGKNLINLKDVSNTLNGLTGTISGNTITINGTNTKTDANWVLVGTGVNLGNSIFPNFKAGETYTLSVSENTKAYIQINYYKGTTTTQASLVFLNLESTKSITFTVPNDFGGVAQFFVGIIKTASNIDTIINIQVEHGTVATSYEPYQEQSYEINLGKNLLDIETNINANTGSGLTLTYNNDGSFNMKGTTTRTYGYITSYYNVNIQPGTYTLSIKQALTYRIYLNLTYFDDTTGSITITAGNTSQTNTIAKAIKKIQIAISTMTNSTYYDETIYIMLEKGNQATSYAPYKTPIELCKIGDYQDRIFKNSGKNLIDIDNITYSNGYYDAAGVWHPNVATNGTIEFIEVLPNTTYTFSINRQVYIFAINEFNESNDFIIRTQISNMQTHTFTTNIFTKYIAIVINYNNATTMTKSLIESLQPQLELGTSATDYEPYGSGKWYLTKEIERINITSSMEWYKSGTTSVDKYYTRVGNWDATLNKFGYCNRFVYKNNGVSVGEFDYSQNGAYLALFFCYATYNTSTVNSFKSWLDSNEVYCYVPISTPTTTEITDTELLAQLNLLSNATTYDETTNILSKGDLPSILNVSATSIPQTTITNIGNIYAKPLLTIKGSGDISVYLNGIQLLQISLGDREEITIDISKMEAYDEDTKVLLNRLVIGDYSKFLINSGVNELLITGDVSNFTMSNYTRWL